MKTYTHSRSRSNSSAIAEELALNEETAMEGAVVYCPAAVYYRDWPNAKTRGGGGVMVSALEAEWLGAENIRPLPGDREQYVADWPQFYWQD